MASFWDELKRKLEEEAKKWLEKNMPQVPTVPTNPGNPENPGTPSGGIVSDKIFGLMLTDVACDVDLKSREKELLMMREKYNTILTLLDLQKNGAKETRKYVDWARTRTELTDLGKKNIEYLHSLGFKVHVILLNSWGAKSGFTSQMGSTQESLINEAALYSSKQLDREREFISDLIDKVGNKISGIMPLLEATQSQAASFGMEMAKSIRAKGFTGQIVFNHIGEARTELNKYNYKSLGILLAGSLNDMNQWRASNNDIRNSDGMMSINANNTSQISEMTGSGGPFGFYIWALDLVGNKNGRSTYSKNYVTYSKAKGSSTPVTPPVNPPTPKPEEPFNESPEARHKRLYPNIQLTGGNAGVAVNKTLWKPQADVNQKPTGNLVVVTSHNLPKMLSASVEKGGTVLESKSVTSVLTAGNGYRLNWRFSKKGSAYGSGLTLRIKTVDGDYVGSIPNGGNRYDPVELKKVSGGANPPVTPDNPPVTPPTNPSDSMKTYFLESADGKSLTLRPDFAAKIRYVDVLTKINDPNVRGSTGPGSQIIIKPVRSGNTWTIPASIYSYPTGNVPNAWRMAFVPPPPDDVKWHTSINQGFVVNGKAYPPTTRK